MARARPPASSISTRRRLEAARYGLAPSGARLVERLTFAHGPGGDGDIEAGGGQGDGRGPADAAAGAGHECDAAWDRHEMRQ